MNDFVVTKVTMQNDFGNSRVDPDVPVTPLIYDMPQCLVSMWTPLIHFQNPVYGSFIKKYN